MTLTKVPGPKAYSPSTLIAGTAFIAVVAYVITTHTLKFNMILTVAIILGVILSGIIVGMLQYTISRNSGGMSFSGGPLSVNGKLYSPRDIQHIRVMTAPTRNSEVRAMEVVFKVRGVNRELTYTDVRNRSKPYSSGYTQAEKEALITWTQAIIAEGEYGNRIIMNSLDGLKHYIQSLNSKD